MEVLGIGPLEFLFIFIVILLVLGPKDIEKTARNLGKGLNKVYRSPNYQVIRKASEEIRNLPARLAAEAQLEELKDMADFKDIEQELKDTVTTVNTAAADPLKAWVEETKKADADTAAPPPVPPTVKPAVTAPNGPAAPKAAAPNPVKLPPSILKPPAAAAADNPPPAPENSIAPPAAAQPAVPATPAAEPAAPSAAEGPKS